ncbi:MAG: pyridoxal-phosphate dependent enzyme [Gammaproteobacteria bacterium]|nr:pyridoxal-phosphate dependent enzyme [Gammaproteobacteria bacterium]MYK37740.1 pyridoxal-phosphate dependent enzyme [Gammaproteobacteria bacterium]
MVVAAFVGHAGGQSVVFSNLRFLRYSRAWRGGRRGDPGFQAGAGRRTCGCGTRRRGARVRVRSGNGGFDRHRACRAAGYGYGAGTPGARSGGYAGHVRPADGRVRPPDRSRVAEGQAGAGGHDGTHSAGDGRPANLLPRPDRSHRRSRAAERGPRAAAATSIRLHPAEAGPIALISASRARACREAIRQGFPWRAIADTPTPVDRHVSLAGELGARSAWIKRDDISGVKHGGNKLRKLEFLLADALEGGYRGVLTYGAVGSNHILSTAHAARSLGLDCCGIVRPQPPTPYVEETLRCHLLLGTRLVAVTDPEATERERERMLAEGGAWYEVPLGGSSALGCLGYVCGALELAEQVKAGECPAPDLIYLPCGSSGSTLGLDLGLSLAGLPTRMVAARVVSESMMPMSRVRSLAGQLRQLLDGVCPLPEDEPLSRVEFRTEFLGTGYALPTDEALAAIEFMKQETNTQLEYTYSGKGAAAMLSDGRKGRHKDLNVLFWNTYNSRPAPAGLPPLIREGLPEVIRASLPPA